MLMATQFGKGRIFHTPLRHVGPRDVEPLARMNCVGFIVTLQRGTEWTATRKVTIPVPADFPTGETTSIRAPEARAYVSCSPFPVSAACLAFAQAAKNAKKKEVAKSAAQRYSTAASGNRGGFFVTPDLDANIISG